MTDLDGSCLHITAGTFQGKNKVKIPLEKQGLEWSMMGGGREATVVWMSYKKNVCQGNFVKGQAKKLRAQRVFSEN